MTVDLLQPGDWLNLAAEFEKLKIESPQFFNWTRQSAMAEFSKSCTLILKRDDEIAAFLTYREYPDRLEIMAVGTNSRFRRLGLGGKILASLESIAAERSLSIWLEVHENNHQAVKFYLKNQFQVIRTRKSYYSDGGSALVMQLL